MTLTAPDATQQDGTYPRPQLVREHWASLDGEWDFAYGDDPRGLPPEFDRRVSVPFPPESQASGIGDTSFHPVVWYRRIIPAQSLREAGLSDEHSRVLLHFGAVDWASDVWVNGHHVGRHVGGYTPFSFDVTDCLHSGEPNDVVVRAHDDPHSVTIQRGKQDWRESPHAIWYERTTGIWQPVWLECVPETSIRSFAWHAEPHRGTVRLEAMLSGRPGSPATLEVSLSHEGERLAKAEIVVDDNRVVLELPLRGQENGQQYEELLWSPNTPTLISASVILRAGAARDAVGSYFGIRSVATEGRQILLNDRPVQIRAVLAQNYWPQSHSAAPSSEALRREVELALELGFNTARIHQKIEDPRFLYWADRLGLMIWEECPSAYAFANDAIQSTTRTWLEALKRDISHPSIIAWVPFNESWGIQAVAIDRRQQAYCSGLTDLTRAMDDTRLVISNDGWEHMASDLWTIHDYEPNSRVLAARYADSERVDAVFDGIGPAGRRLLADGAPSERPVVLSEFGGVSMSAEDGSWGYSQATSAREFQRRVDSVLTAAREAKGLAGFCYTQLTDTGQETNGLLTAEREPKYDIADIRRAVAGVEPAQS